MDGRIFKILIVLFLVLSPLKANAARGLSGETMHSISDESTSTIKSCCGSFVKAVILLSRHKDR
jgi:hypothetical protein